MRLSALVVLAAIFGLAALLSFVAAGFAVTVIEEATEIDVRRALDADDLGWAEVEADGLTVLLTGIAPDEAARLQARSAAGRLVDAARIIDDMDVTTNVDRTPPRFSVEILKNDSGISLIGLAPKATDRANFQRILAPKVGEGTFSDLLEEADYPVPPGWQDAMGFALTALQFLPSSKISVEAGRVSIMAISGGADEKSALQNRLERAAPPGLTLLLDIAQPRPVLTPFRLRFAIDTVGARLAPCAADTEAAAARIGQAALAAGAATLPDCTVAIGAPSPYWADAATYAIAALSELGAGSVTITDTDIDLIAAEGIEEPIFDRVTGALRGKLPDAFALRAVRTLAESAGGPGPAEFTATLSPEGLVQMRGRLGDEALRDAVDSYARAAFGSATVHMATRLGDDLPEAWPLRVLTGLEALAQLKNGALLLTENRVSLQGVTALEEGNARIAALLEQKLDDAALVEMSIQYVPPPPEETVPTSPEACEATIADILEQRQISFEPGSDTIDEESERTMNAIAGILGECGDIKLEIQGHTDSQGRESMNLDLSQKRAQSVLNELLARRIITSSYVAKGYGEDQPIADNGTEAGREANRRIEFHLIRPKPTAEETRSTLDGLAEPANAEE